VTPTEANQAWQKATYHPDKKFFDIMKHLCDSRSKYDMTLLISRNPCINYGSFLTLKVARIKDDIYDKTVSIDDLVIRKLNLDFDGDILNIYRIFNRDVIQAFAKNMDPKYNMHISRGDGRVDRDLMPSKDVATNFYGFNRC
jgi:hypothetical protein